MSLTLDSLSLTRGAQTLLADISLTLEKGSLNVLLGATLAGQDQL
jgi:glycerol transport system ATP-binding protein